MNKLRSDFLEGLKKMPVELEPEVEGLDLTNEEVEKKVESYSKLLKSAIIEVALNKEEER